MALALGWGLAAALLTQAPAAEAQDLNGERLLQFCESEGGPDLALCHGFFRGLSDTHSIYAAMGKGLHLYCLPQGITQEQFENVAFKWMRAHPEHMQRPAAVLIVQALHEGFPCEEDGAAAGSAPEAPEAVEEGTPDDATE